MKHSTPVLASATCSAARIFRCPANNEIKATVPSNDQDGLGTMARIHETLLSCPYVSSLDLRVTLMGCSNEPDRWNFPFRLTGGDIYPNLTSLKVEGYDFKQSDWKDVLPIGYDFDALLSWVSYRCQKWYSLWRNTPLARRYLTNLQLWLEAMDWTKLKSLTLIDNADEHFAEFATPYLSGLETLHVHSNWWKTSNAAQHIISTLPAEVALVNLTWSGAWEPEALDMILERHGTSLSRLELYSKEPWYTNEAAALTALQLEMIASKATKLRHLSFTMDRNGSWPWHILKAVSQIRSLVSADIWLELAADCMRGKRAHSWMPGNGKSCQNEEMFRQPVLNETSANEVFTYLLQENKGGLLHNVTFYIGDWSRPWDGPLYDPSWLEYRRGKVECSVIDNGGLGKGKYDSSCVHTVDEVHGGIWDGEDEEYSLENADYYWTVDQELKQQQGL